MSGKTSFRGHVSRLCMVMAGMAFLAAVFVATAAHAMSAQKRVMNAGSMEYNVDTAPPTASSSGSGSSGGDGSGSGDESGSSGSGNEPVGDSHYDGDIDALVAAYNNFLGSRTSSSCTDLPKWFIENYTTLSYGGTVSGSRWDGGDVAWSLSQTTGLALLNRPVAIGIFSARDSKWHSAMKYDSSYPPPSGSRVASGDFVGHTGLVIAVNGSSVTVIHTWSGQRAIKETISWSAGDRVEFVYLGDHLK
jgi:hypothetical protein